MKPRATFSDALVAEGASGVAVRRIVGDQNCGRASPVTHGHAVVALYVSGAACMEQNGEWTLAPGDALLVPPGQPHRRLDGRAAEYWGLGFSAPCVAARGDTALLEPFERVRDGAAAVVRVAAERQAFLQSLLSELGSLQTSSRWGSERASVERSLLTLILNEVQRAAALVHALPHAASSSVVAESLRFIERHALRRLTLTEVAEAVGRTPAYVTNALSRATGRSAVQWIIGARMAEARRLLLHSDERVDVIAERVGYADPTHFIRMFRREHGCTPAAWRAARTQPEEFTRDHAS